MRTYYLGIGGLVCSLLAGSLSATYQDEIGLTTLRARDATLDGSGVTVAQVEAQIKTGGWQVDPADVGLDAGLFTYYTTTATYPTGASFDIELESYHANIVGARFFGLTSGTQGTNGVAPGVAAIQNFYAGYFFNSLILTSTNISTQVVNQSYVYSSLSEADSTTVNQYFDNYASNYGVIFCNGLNTEVNPATIPSPASTYNGITVGVVDDSLTSLSDGRSKPDIVAPGSTAASYTTPLVAGAATILYQSGARADAGSGTESDATDIRTIKTLLLNSATKPSGWSHTSTHPLDTTNGAGVLEINQAQLQLEAGQYGETVDDNLTTSGADHLPPGGISDNLSANTGWNLSTLTNARVTGQYRDATDHYFFNCDAAEASSFNLTATLVWNRNAGRSNINNLDLFLYKEDGTLVASSVSTVDNVEHLYELALEAGRYVLQVYKPAADRDTTSETYALAFNFEAAAPVAAGDATALTLSSSSIQLDWTDNAGNETGYRIERRISGGSYSSLTTLAADIETYTDESCEAGTTYEYQIIAFNDDGDATAATASATTYSVQEQWRLDYFGSISNSGDGADDADPELDGQINLVEFSTAGDPGSFSPNPVSSDTLGSSGQFSFIWRTNSGFDFAIGYSEDLVAGFTYYDSSTLDSDLSPELELIGTSTIDSEFETRTYGIRDSVTSDKVFIQLQIITP
ncbi:fibronectin type III domain-containing protein [Coraliomargarita parva]|uniref:fibronectin type III domain-containing protein n=1 Tax=Coraliomargarita parva TaxID=3014050 RepID=UPI0022B50601|nr:S8 family serine peptidase [Coraliomargarita parva]